MRNTRTPVYAPPAPGQASLPNLLIIGAAKAGTTALHRYLALHPEVAMSEPKELHLFDFADWRSKVDWYRSHFRLDAPVRGESSPSYSMHPTIPCVPERIRELLPTAKLIYLVRDPVERVLAHWVENFALQLENSSFEEALASPEDPANRYVAASSYATQLERYLEHFPAEQLLVLDQRRLLDDRRSALESVFSFLGVDSGFWTQAFLEAHNVRDAKVRLNTRGVWIYRRGLWPRLRRALPRMQPRIRKAVISVIAEPVRTPELDSKLRDRLELVLHNDAERLRELTGQRFESWSV